jgi:hypothetical protein
MLFYLRAGSSVSGPPPSPPPPPPPPQVVSGGAGAPAFRRYRKSDYRDALTYYRKELRQQEKQEELAQLQEILSALPAIEEPKTEDLSFIAAGVAALAEAIEQYKAERSSQAAIKRQIEQLAREIQDDDDAMSVIVSLI